MSPKQTTPQIDIGGKVYTCVTKKRHMMETIHEGSCPKCGYDRVTVAGDTMAGVYGVSCNNCGFGHEA